MTQQQPSAQQPHDPQQYAQQQYAPQPEAARPSYTAGAGLYPAARRAAGEPGWAPQPDADPGARPSGAPTPAQRLATALGRSRFWARPASTGMRLLGYTIDALVTVLFALAAWLATSSPLLAAIVLLEYLVIVVVIEARTGATPAQLLLRMRTTRDDSPFSIGFGRAALRALVQGVGSLVLFVGGWIIVATSAADAQRAGRSIADRAGRALVVKVPSKADRAAESQRAAELAARGPRVSVTRPGELPVELQNLPARQYTVRTPVVAPPPRRSTPPAGEGAQGAEMPVAPIVQTPVAPVAPVAPVGLGALGESAAPEAPAAPAAPVYRRGQMSYRGGAAAGTGFDAAVASVALGASAAIAPMSEAPEASAPSREPAYEPAVPSALLLGFDTGQRVEVPAGSSVNLGRKPEPIADDDRLVIVQDPDGTVSKTHLRIEHRSGAVWLIDQGSTNGTEIFDEEGRGTVLSKGERVLLEEGSRVRIGHRSFTVATVEGA